MVQIKMQVILGQHYLSSYQSRWNNQYFRNKTLLPNSLCNGASYTSSACLARNVQS